MDHRRSRPPEAAAQHVDRLIEQAGGRIVVGDVERGLHTTRERAATGDRTRSRSSGQPTSEGEAPTLVQGGRLERVNASTD